MLNEASALLENVPEHACVQLVRAAKRVGPHPQPRALPQDGAPGRGIWQLFQLGRLLDRLPDELWHHVMSFAIQRPDYELPPTDARVDYSSTSLSISGWRRILCGDEE